MRKNLESKNCINNTVFGENALANNSEGNINTIIGYGSMYNNIDGSYNIGIGYKTMFYNKSSNGNIVIGNKSLYDNSYNNIVVGHESLNKFSSSNNIVIGSKNLLKQSNNILLGNNNNFDNINNRFIVADNNHVIIDGNFTNQTIKMKNIIANKIKICNILIDEKISNVGRGTCDHDVLIVEQLDDALHNYLNVNFRGSGLTSSFFPKNKLMFGFNNFNKLSLKINIDDKFLKINSKNEISLNDNISFDNIQTTSLFTIDLNVKNYIFANNLSINYLSANTDGNRSFNIINLQNSLVPIDNSIELGSTTNNFGKIHTDELNSNEIKSTDIVLDNVTKISDKSIYTLNDSFEIYSNKLHLGIDSNKLKESEEIHINSNKIFIGGKYTSEINIDGNIDKEAYNINIGNKSIPEDQLNINTDLIYLVNHNCIFDTQISIQKIQLDNYLDIKINESYNNIYLNRSSLLLNSTDNIDIGLEFSKVINIGNDDTILNFNYKSINFTNDFYKDYTVNIYKESIEGDIEKLFPFPNFHENSIIDFKNKIYNKIILDKFSDPNENGFIDYQKNIYPFPNFRLYCKIIFNSGIPENINDTILLNKIFDSISQKYMEYPIKNIIIDENFKNNIKIYNNDDDYFIEIYFLKKDDQDNYIFDFIDIINFYTTNIFNAFYDIKYNSEIFNFFLDINGTIDFIGDNYDNYELNIYVEKPLLLSTSDFDTGLKTNKYKKFSLNIHNLNNNFVSYNLSGYYGFLKLIWKFNIGEWVIVNSDNFIINYINFSFNDLTFQNFDGYQYLNINNNDVLFGSLNDSFGIKVFRVNSKKYINVSDTISLGTGNSLSNTNYIYLKNNELIKLESSEDIEIYSTNTYIGSDNTEIYSNNTYIDSYTTEIYSNNTYINSYTTEIISNETYINSDYIDITGLGINIYYDYYNYIYLDSNFLLLSHDTNIEINTVNDTSVTRIGYGSLINIYNENKKIEYQGINELSIESNIFTLNTNQININNKDGENILKYEEDGNANIKKIIIGDDNKLLDVNIQTNKFFLYNNVDNDYIDLDDSYIKMSHTNVIDINISTNDSITHIGNSGTVGYPGLLNIYNKSKNVSFNYVNDFSLNSQAYSLTSNQININNGNGDNILNYKKGETNNIFIGFTDSSQIDSISNQSTNTNIYMNDPKSNVYINSLILTNYNSVNGNTGILKLLNAHSTNKIYQTLNSDGTNATTFNFIDQFQNLPSLIELDLTLTKIYLGNTTDSTAMLTGFENSTQPTYILVPSSNKTQITNITGKIFYFYVRNSSIKYTKISVQLQNLLIEMKQSQVNTAISHAGFQVTYDGINFCLLGCANNVVGINS